MKSSEQSAAGSIKLKNYNFGYTHLAHGYTPDSDNYTHASYGYTHASDSIDDGTCVLLTL